MNAAPEWIYVTCIVSLRTQNSIMELVQLLLFYISHNIKTILISKHIFSTFKNNCFFSKASFETRYHMQSITRLCLSHSGQSLLFYGQQINFQWQMTAFSCLTWNYSWLVCLCGGEKIPPVKTCKLGVFKL